MPETEKKKKRQRRDNPIHPKDRIENGRIDSAHLLGISPNQFGKKWRQGLYPPPYRYCGTRPMWRTSDLLGDVTGPIKETHIEAPPVESTQDEDWTPEL